MNKAIKYRIYPNNEQDIQIQKTFGCARKVYNELLSYQQELYKHKEKKLSKYGMNDYCTHVIKKELPYLKEVDKFALTNSVFALDKAYDNFFSGIAKFPKFKSKHKSKKSYTTNMTNNNIKLGDKYIKLPKLGDVKAKIHRTPLAGWEIKSATVSQTPDGKFYCSVLFEYDADIKKASHPEKNAIGLDYKSNGLYTDSEGNTCGSPKFYRKGQKRLTKAQRALRHKKKGSNNYEKAKRKVSRIHQHVANQRKDFLHKKSTEIANQYDMVCVETLNMRAMSNKGFGNGKATMDNGYGMFLDMLEYKLEDRGKVLIRIDKWFPSSQTCSVCGAVHPEIKDLSIRKWTCPDCGTLHDRDINAAINIKSKGIEEYLAG